MCFDIAIWRELDRLASKKKFTFDDYKKWFGEHNVNLEKRLKITFKNGHKLFGKIWFVNVLYGNYGFKLEADLQSTRLNGDCEVAWALDNIIKIEEL